MLSCGAWSVTHELRLLTPPEDMGTYMFNKHVGRI